MALQPRLVGAVLLAALTWFSCSTTVTADAGTEPPREVSAPPVAEPVVVEAPPAPAQLSFTTNECDRPDCVLTLVFSHAMNPAATPEVTFTPKLKGTFTWSSDTELQFQPSKPLTAGEGLIITVKNARAADQSVLAFDEQSAPDRLPRHRSVVR